MIHITGNFNTLHNLMENYRKTVTREDEREAALLLTKIRIVV